MESLNGKASFIEMCGGSVQTILLGIAYKIDNFHLQAYNELEAYFDDPEPYLAINLTSASVIARIINTNSILLVEFNTEEGRRVELPAGKVESDVDRSIHETVSREFTEETGGVVSLKNLKPVALTYHKDGKGGLQFYAEISRFKSRQCDRQGRRYLTPPKGTDDGKVMRLIAEPLDIFLDPEKTLLRYSHNQWAHDEIFRLTFGMYIKRLSGGKF